MSSAAVPAARESAPSAARIPDLSVVVVNWNARDALIECLESLRRISGEVSLEAVVVDNGSRDGSAEAVSTRFPEFRLIANRANAGFARANNQAFSSCAGRYILLLNPDTIANAEALQGLVDFMDRTSDAGAAGLQLRFPDGRLQNSYDSFPVLSTELLSKHLLRILFPGRFPSKRTVPLQPVPVDIVIGACLIVRTELLRRLGGLDEGYFLFVEEADLCRRIWDAGWKVYHLPQLSICHCDHVSKAQAPAHAYIEYFRSNYYFFRKHRHPLVSAAFEVLKTLKLFLISLPLSIGACAFTAGRVPRHRRRLRIRSLLAAWHLLGCPASWGMRQVSGFRDHERKRERRGPCFREAIVPRDADSGLRSLLAEAERALPGGIPGAETIKEGRRKTSYRVPLAADVALPGFLGSSARGAAGSARRRLLITAYRPRSFPGNLWRILMVAPGVGEFERAVEVADRGLPTVPPVAAGCERRLGLVRYSYIAYLEDPALEKLQGRIDAEAGAERGAAHRGWVRAYGRLVRRMHDAGVDQYDLNPGNALVRAGAGPEDQDALLISDLERVEIGPPLEEEARRRALARLNRLGAGLTRADRLRFLDAYLGGPEPPRAQLREWAGSIAARMPALRRRDGARAARTCTTENHLFGRTAAGHFRRRAYPWERAVILDERSAEDLTSRVLSGEPLPAGLEALPLEGRRGIRGWREANRSFQGNGGAVPILYVAGGKAGRIVWMRREGRSP